MTAPTLTQVTAATDRALEELNRYTIIASTAEHHERARSAINALAAEVRAYRERCAPGASEPAQDEPVVWVVNDNGELGVELPGGRVVFLYKGRCLEYDGYHGDGTRMRYRQVQTREFGECAMPRDWYDPDRVSERLGAECPYTKGEGWRDLPVARKASPPSEEPDTAGLDALRAVVESDAEYREIRSAHGPAELEAIADTMDATVNEVVDYALENAACPRGRAPTGPGWWLMVVEVTRSGDGSLWAWPFGDPKTNPLHVDRARWGGPCLQGSAPADPPPVAWVASGVHNEKRAKAAEVKLEVLTLAVEVVARFAESGETMGSDDYRLAMSKIGPRLRAALDAAKGDA